LARFFLDSHVDYVPESIVWPQLADSSRERLTGLPFWQEAVATENITSNTVAAAARLEPDPEIRKAIEMQGFEENRHARLLGGADLALSDQGGHAAAFEPRSLENDFLFAGFGECFVAFSPSVYSRVAQKSGYFGPELIAISNPWCRRGASYPVFRQLGEVPPSATPVVEAAGVPAALRLDHPETGGEPHQDGAQHGRRAPIPATNSR